MTATFVAAAPEAHRAKILGMACIAGCVVANIYFCQPMLPLIAADLKISPGSVGLIPGFTLAGFSLGLATLVPLGDRFNRKILVLAQIGLAGIFCLLAGVSPNAGALLAASFGIGVTSCVPQQLVPFAATMSPPAERGRSVGTVVGGIMMGLLLGRVAGGALSSAFGWRSVYLLAAVFMVAMGAVAARMLPNGEPTTEMRYGRLMASLWTLFARHGTLRRAMATQALVWVAFNAFWANLATLLAESPEHLGPIWAGGFGLVGLVGALAANLGGRAADRLGPTRVLSISFALVTASYLLMFAATWTLWAAVIGVIVLDLGCQSALVANQTRIFGLDLKAQGRLNTLYMTATFLGGAVGAALSGWLMAKYGWSGVAALGCAAGLAAAAIHASS